MLLRISRSPFVHDVIDNAAENRKSSCLVNNCIDERSIESYHLEIRASTGYDYTFCGRGCSRSFPADLNKCFFNMLRFLARVSFCPQVCGARPAGTVSTGLDHACHTEQELQNIGGRCSKKSHEKQFQGSMQSRYEQIGNEQYCADWMQFYGGIYFRFHSFPPRI